MNIKSNVLFRFARSESRKNILIAINIILVDFVFIFFYITEYKVDESLNPRITEGSF